MTIGYEGVIDMWNEMVLEIYESWRDWQIANDVNCPDPFDPKYHNYKEENYSYEIFCETSEENKALIYITRMSA